MIKKSHPHHLSTVLDLKEDLKSYTHAAMYTMSEVSLLQQFDKCIVKCTTLYKKNMLNDSVRKVRTEVS